jgi:hypothetical protein
MCCYRLEQDLKVNVFSNHKFAIPAAVFFEFFIELGFVLEPEIFLGSGSLEL